MFTSTDDGQGRPLDRCLRWTAAQDQAYMVLAHEDRTTVRCYQAMDADELRVWATTTSAAHRHAHEVISWPTKLYGDVDLEPGAASEEQFRVALDALIKAAELRFDVVCDEPVVLDASSSTKFSRHFIVDMRRRDGDGQSVRFATPLDCGSFVRSVDASKGVCDMAVYRRNNCMRVYGSTKCDAPDRPFRPIGVDSSRTTIEWSLFERSLVSWPRVTDSRRLLVVAEGVRAPASAATAEPKHRPQRLQSGGGGIDDALQMISRIDCIREAGIMSVKRSERSGMYFVNTRSKHCAKKGSAHRSSTIYFLVDLTARRYKQLCHSGHCPSPYVAWQSVDSKFGIVPVEEMASTSSSSDTSSISQPVLKRPRTPNASYPDDIRRSFLALSSSSVADSSDASRSL
jgi:hypothetical protein